MKLYFAALNKKGFANSWDVLVFDSKDNRHKFVASNDGYFDGSNAWKCKSITRRDATKYAANWDATRNEPNSPKPFSNERWMISDYKQREIVGWIGDLIVGHDCDGIPLNSLGK